MNSVLSNFVANFTSRCRGLTQEVFRALRLLTPSESTDVQKQMGQDFTRATGYRVEFTMQPTSRIAEEILFQLQTNVSLYDAWVLDVAATEPVLRAGGASVLDDITDPQVVAALADDDVHPFFQRYGGRYDGRRTGIVLSGQVPLLYWRRDLFARFLGLTSPPSTWEELLAVARALNGTDLNGDGIPDQALCTQSLGCNDAGTWFASILATMTQYQGSSSGWVLDPTDLNPLAAGPPLLRALALFRNLTALEARGGSGCQYLHGRFLNSTCAITINWMHQFKVPQLRFPQLHGQVGVAPLPGSTRVWNRQVGAWTSCNDDPSPCPYATLATQLPTSLSAPQQRQQQLLLSPLQQSPSPPQAAGGQGSPTSRSSAASSSALPSTASTSGSSGGNSSNGGSGSGNSSGGAGGLGSAAVSGSASTSTGAVNRVNRAPYTGMVALVGSVDVRARADYQAAAVTFFAQITSPNASWEQLSLYQSAVGPFRKQHLDPANVPRWLSLGYDQRDLEPFLATLRDAIEHPNLAVPLRMPGTPGIKAALMAASQLALGDGSLEEVAAAVAAEMKAAVDVDVPQQEFKRLYWDSLGYTAPDAPAPPPASQSWGALSQAARIGVGVAVAVTGLAAVVLAGHCWYRRRRRLLRRTLFGKAMAPGASPATSLVVTDIVDSTRLWETVPQAAMARAVQLHHDTLRSLLDGHNGYESATEGDSFILSFYTAADALAFSLRAQLALIIQPWPEELLQQDLCRPQYAVCRAPGAGPERSRAGIPLPSLLPSRHQLTFQTHGSLPNDVLSPGGTQSQLVFTSGPVGSRNTVGSMTPPTASLETANSGFGSPGGGGGGGASGTISATFLRLGAAVVPSGMHGSAFGGGGTTASSGARRAQSGSTLQPAAQPTSRLWRGVGAGGSGDVSSGDGGGPGLTSSHRSRATRLWPSTPQLSLGVVQSGSLSGGRGGNTQQQPLPLYPPVVTSASLTPASLTMLSHQHLKPSASKDGSRLSKRLLLRSRGTSVSASNLNTNAKSDSAAADGSFGSYPGPPPPTSPSTAGATDRRPGVAGLRLETAIGAPPGAEGADGSAGSSGNTSSVVMRRLPGREGSELSLGTAAAAAAAGGAKPRGAGQLRSLLAPRPSAAAAELSASQRRQRRLSSLGIAIGGSGGMPYRSSPFGVAVTAVTNPLANTPYGITSAEQDLEPDTAGPGGAGGAAPDGLASPTASVPGSGSGAMLSSDIPSNALLSLPPSADDGPAVSVRVAAAATALGTTVTAAGAEVLQTEGDSTHPSTHAFLTTLGLSLPTGTGGANFMTSTANTRPGLDGGRGVMAAGGLEGPAMLQDDSNLGTLEASTGEGMAAGFSGAYGGAINGSGDVSGGFRAGFTAGGVTGMSAPLQMVALQRRKAVRASSAAAEVQKLPAGCVSVPMDQMADEVAPVSIAATAAAAGGAGGYGITASAASGPTTMDSERMSATFTGMWSKAATAAITASMAATAGTPGGGGSNGGDGGGEGSQSRARYSKSDSDPLAMMPVLAEEPPVRTSRPRLSRGLTLLAGGGTLSSAQSRALRTSISGPLSVPNGGLLPYRRASMAQNSALTAALMNINPSIDSHGTSASGAAGEGPVRSLTLGAYYQQLFRMCPPSEPGAVQVGGGLQIRIGVHSGVASTEVSYNRVAGRTQYSGAVLDGAKAVGDAAQGGMVLLSRSTLEQLTRPGGGGGSGRDPPYVLLDMGSHVIKMGPDPVQLYLAQHKDLLARVAFMGPLRSSSQVEAGVTEAPLGEVSMAALLVVGLPTLMAWDKDATEEALATFRRVVLTVAMRSLGGHLVEEGPGKVLAAFGHPYDAIRWAAACEALLKEAEWSEALLGHELAEEVQGPVLLNSHIDAPVLMADGDLSRMLFRGLRIKGAVDCAAVRAELVPATGRLTYRGNLAHNVQRIASYVSTGQMVCTRRAWRAYEASLEEAALVAGAAEVVGASLGHHSIRGVGDKIELWSIRLAENVYDRPDPSFGGGGCGGGAVGSADDPLGILGGAGGSIGGQVALDLSQPQLPSLESLGGSGGGGSYPMLATAALTLASPPLGGGGDGAAGSIAAAAGGGGGVLSVSADDMDLRLAVPPVPPALLLTAQQSLSLAPWPSLMPPVLSSPSLNISPGQAAHMSPPAEASVTLVPPSLAAGPPLASSPSLVLASPGPGNAVVGGAGGVDNTTVASRLGLSLAGALRNQTPAWDVPGEELRDMLSD